MNIERECKRNTKQLKVVTFSNIYRARRSVGIIIQAFSSWFRWKEKVGGRGWENGLITLRITITRRASSTLATNAYKLTYKCKHYSSWFRQ